MMTTTPEPAWLRIAVLTGSLLLGIAGCSGFSPPRGYEAALLLADVAASGRTTTLQRTTPSPIRLSLQYAVQNRPHRAHGYLPGQPARAGIVLIHGMAEAGPEDPRLVAFATSLARARFMVLVPELRGLQSLEVSVDDVRAIVDAFSYLSAHPHLAPQDRIGIGAFSYGVGPAMLASLHKDIRNDVSFILAAGGYHDLRDVVTFFTTGYFQADGEQRFLEPNEYGKWIFVLSNAKRLSDPQDRQILQEIAQRKLEDLSDPVADLAERLGPDGTAVYALITNDDPQRTPTLLSRLPEDMRADLAALNLANKDLSLLRAHVILIHGRDDNIIPYTESIALKRRLGDRAELFLVHGLQHVDVQPKATDLYRLWRAAYALLTARDRIRAAERTS